MKTRCADVREELTLRTTADLYHHIVEVLKYSKHKKDVLASKNVDDEDIEYLFHAQLKCGESTGKPDP